MSLRYALLVTLLDGEASGYELAKRFDASVASFWHARPPQLYAELARMEEAELVSSTTVVQERRPNKRLFALTRRGREELRDWLHQPSRLNATKDELLVRLTAVEEMGPEYAAAALDERRKQAAAKLYGYRTTMELLLGGRDEEDFLRTAPRIGPYLTLHRGITYEAERVAWCDWALATLRRRAHLAAGQPSGDRPPTRRSPR